jgi:hypothetical protein
MIAQILSLRGSILKFELSFTVVSEPVNSLLIFFKFPFSLPLTKFLNQTYTTHLGLLYIAGNAGIVLLLKYQLTEK